MQAQRPACALYLNRRRPPALAGSFCGPIKTFEYIGDKRRLLAYRSFDTLLARINHIGALLAQPA